MPRSFEFSIESSATVEQIHSAFCNEEYWRARLAVAGAVLKLDSLTIDANGAVTVVTIQGAGHEGLPGLIAKFYPSSWQVVHNETWTPLGEGVVRGDVSSAARGAPGSVHGHALLAPAQSGSRFTCTASVEFKIPLVGGKIESMVGRHMPEQFLSAERFTAEWIKEHS